MHIHSLQIDQGTREVLFYQKVFKNVNKEIHFSCKDWNH